MKLFGRIFLCFWFTTLLMIVFVLAMSQMFSLNFPDDHKARIEPLLLTVPFTNAINLYETSGVDAFRHSMAEIHGTSQNEIFLFDHGNHLVLGDVMDDDAARAIAADALERNTCQLNRLDFRVFYACPVQSSKGNRYAIVLGAFSPLSRLLNPRFWVNFTMAMFPAALVCALLTYYLTRPIARLQTAARRLADGELKARAGSAEFGRKDELGDLARDFDAMAAQIELLMTAQRRFVADVSHELGAPLTRMHLALALLRRQMEEESNTALLRLERETEGLSTLVQQLLLLASLEVGRIPSETFVPVSIRSLCESIIEDANFEASHLGCQITGVQQDVILLVYPNLLRRAIDNVLRNAIRYSAGKGIVRLDCKADLVERCVTLTVSDSGPGVPENMLSDIFKPFFRTSPGREAGSGGTGLGLSIAYEAIALHDGSIVARNLPKGGLQVVIHIPLRTPMADEQEAEAEIV